jgi:vacuolar-type H+-ATPase subunit E/Vma4
MENHTEIKALAKHIEGHVGVLLEEIEKQKKAILSKAKQDALIELHNAKKLSKKIIDSTIRQTQTLLNKIKEKIVISHPLLNISDAQKFIIERSVQDLEKYLEEINQINEPKYMENNEPVLEFW